MEKRDVSNFKVIVVVVVVVVVEYFILYIEYYCWRPLTVSLSSRRDGMATFFKTWSPVQAGA